MLQGLSKKLFGTVNERIVKAHAAQISAINDLERSLEALSDEELRAKTAEYRKRVADGETLEDLLIEAFAITREAAKRTLGQRHYDVQLVGGIVLHQGKIAEMATGEGKTLVATLPVYLNALEGKGVHVITVNDYLAQRDAAWMGEIYQFLGLTVGCIVHGLDDKQRREQYGADVTYGTNNEFGFDYLRDNMKFTLETMVQRPFNFAIVDEVDSILIDEARTPLIISGPSEDSSEMYQLVDRVIPELEEGDFEIDEKARAATLTDEGAERVEALLTKHNLLSSPNLYDIENVSVVHHLNQAVRAHKMFERDTAYIVKDGRVVIIDEFTGRMMPGRRFSEGLHQALEAKENVQVQQENQTLASITFQNYFRMYPKLAGMTGTAATEAAELGDIYGLDVIQIPTNEPCIRDDRDDEVYRTAGEKWHAIVELLRDCQTRGQPVLVGTTSIEKSELLGRASEKGIGAAQRAQRPLSRARGAHHRAGGPGRRAHHRNQHGRAAAPTFSLAATWSSASPASSATKRTRWRRNGPLPTSVPRSPPRARRCSPPAGSWWSAASAMRRGASTTSCAAARAGRAIPVPRSSSSRSKTISCAYSVPSAWTRCSPSSG